MKYRIGWPGWRLIYKLTNCTLEYRYDIYKSKESGDFLADSPDIKGLFVECKTLDELLELTPQLAQELVADMLHEDKQIKLVALSPIGLV